MEKTTLTSKAAIGTLHRALDFFGVLTAAEAACRPAHVWFLTWPRSADRQTLITIRGNEPVDLLIGSQIEQIQSPGELSSGVDDYWKLVVKVLSAQFSLVAETTAADVLYHGKVPIAVVGIAGLCDGGGLLAKDIARVTERVTILETALHEVEVYRHLLERCDEALLVTQQDGRIIAGTQAGRRLLRIALYGSPRSPYKSLEDALPANILSTISVGLPALSNKVEITASRFRGLGRSGLIEPVIWVMLRTVEENGSAISPERLSKLTPVQKEVFRCLISGDRNKQVASRLGISVFTARNHVSSILQVLGCADRLELIARYRRFNAALDENTHVPPLMAAPFMGDLPLPITAKRI